MVDHYSSDKGVSRFLRFMYWAPVLALSIENRYVNDRESALRLGLITLEHDYSAGCGRRKSAAEWTNSDSGRPCDSTCSDVGGLTSISLPGVGRNSSIS